MSLPSSTTFKVAGVKPRQHWYLKSPTYKKESYQDQLEKLPWFQDNWCKEILQSSSFPPEIVFSDKGFVHTVVECYNNHYNLILRPDDIWAAIMTQFSFYINNHSEEFRSKFVDFEGKQELSVMVEEGSLKNAPYDVLVKLMTNKIDENLVDSQVKNWIMPEFSTTTENDLTTFGVLFMASMKNYFDYEYGLRCGIPNITLEGTVDDWINIHSRLEKLKEFKLKKWYDMLEPVIQQFINARKGKVDRDFWQRICHYRVRGSGPTYVSGWITVFSVFNKEGNWQESDLELTCCNSRKKWLVLETNKIPTGIVDVKVKVTDADSGEYKTIMFAGHLGSEIKEDGCTVQPMMGWVIASLLLDKEKFLSRLS